MSNSIKEATTFYFAGYDCQLETERYHNNKRLAVRIVAAVTEDNADRGVYGVPMGTLSINIDSDILEDGEFAAKTYSENEALLDAVIAAGLVECTRKVTPEGFPIARLV